MIYRWKSAFFLLTFFLLALLAQSQDVSKRAVKLTRKAIEARKQRDFVKAKELFNKVIEIEPQYNQPYLELASIYYLYQRKDTATGYYNKYVSITPETKISDGLWKRVAQLNFEHGNYEEAEFAAEHVKNPDSLLLKSIRFSLEAVNNASVLEKEVLPPAINSFQLQYFPVFTVDERMIIYTKRNANHPAADEDLVISKQINGEWIPAQSLSNVVNTAYNEGACTITADGRTLIFTSCEGRTSFGSCDLYVTYREGNRWSKPENLGANVNSKYWESQPALSADGRSLFFSSNRPGGFGKRDIWKTTLKEDGWSEPVNLGSEVNTDRDETTPYIHVNNELLFFSSDGHVGLGGFDLLMSRLHGGKWTSPTNLGYPINTFEDEFSLFINATGTTGYFAQESQKGGIVVSSELVKFQIPEDSLVVNKSSFVTGRVINEATGAFMGAQIKMTDLSDSTNNYFVRADSVTGRYYLVLTSGNDYGVFVEKKGFLFEDFRFKASVSSVLKPDSIDIYLRPLKHGERIQLENIYFDLDKYTLRPESKMELNAISEYLQNNPKLNFVIEGHTDNVGGEAYNEELSRLRANTVYQFLLQRGVDEDRMAYLGLGSQEPLASNDTEEGREKNRRITFRVISND